MDVAWTCHRMDLIYRKIRAVQREFNVSMSYEQVQKLATVSFNARWEDSEIFCSHLTELGSSHLFYVDPEFFLCLSTLTNSTHDYVELEINNRTVYVLGFGTQAPKLSLFWTDSMGENYRKITNCRNYVLAEMGMAHAVQIEMDRGEGRVDAIVKAYDQGMKLLKHYYELRIRCASALNMDNDAYDVTRSKFVNLAESLLDYYPDDAPPLNRTTVDVCRQVVAFVHHRRFDKNEHYTEGPLKLDQLFLDR